MIKSTYRRTGKIILAVGLVWFGLLFYDCGSQKSALQKSDIFDDTPIDQNDPDGLPTIRQPGWQFFKSYRQRGGPHLVIDSLNVAIPLSETELRAMLTFAKSALPYDNLRSNQISENTSDEYIIKYFPTNQTTKQLLAREAPYAAVREGAYFKGIFDQDGKLLSLEYFDKSNPEPIEPVRLTTSQATSWDLIFNRPFYYANEDGQRFPSRAVVLRDSTRRVRYVDYLSETGDKIARGTFAYGLSDQIIEQRIEFAGEGCLTSLNPFLFDKQFNIVKPGWIVKGLYNNRKYLKKFVVMDDFGNRYYDYRFSYQKTSEGMTVVNQIFDQTEQIASRSELFYNERGRLLKRIGYGKDQAITDYQIFAIDYEKMKLIVEFYRPDGVMIDRLYQSL